VSVWLPLGVPWASTTLRLPRLRCSDRTAIFNETPKSCSLQRTSSRNSRRVHRKSWRRELRLRNRRKGLRPRRSNRRARGKKQQRNTMKILERNSAARGISYRLGRIFLTKLPHDEASTNKEFEQELKIDSESARRNSCLRSRRGRPGGGSTQAPISRESSS
jgi:hypothetical protein